jgi:hypothetical protein
MILNLIQTDVAKLVMGTIRGVRGGTGCFSFTDTNLAFMATSLSAAPELSPCGMMILGFAGVGLMAYRRKSKPQHPSSGCFERLPAGRTRSEAEFVATFCSAGVDVKQPFRTESGTSLLARLWLRK